MAIHPSAGPNSLPQEGGDPYEGDQLGGDQLGGDPHEGDGLDVAIHPSAGPNSLLTFVTCLRYLELLACTKLDQLIWSQSNRYLRNQLIELF